VPSPTLVLLSAVLVLLLAGCAAPPPGEALPGSSSPATTSAPTTPLNPGTPAKPSLALADARIPFTAVVESSIARAERDGVLELGGDLERTVLLVLDRSVGGDYHAAMSTFDRQTGTTTYELLFEPDFFTAYGALNLLQSSATTVSRDQYGRYRLRGDGRTVLYDIRDGVISNTSSVSPDGDTVVITTRYDSSRFGRSVIRTALAEFLASFEAGADDGASGEGTGGGAEADAESSPGAEMENK
jgi:hypothetical protein